MANKVLFSKTILKPVWTYGIPLWGSASHSNIEILCIAPRPGRPGPSEETVNRIREA